jgi:acyl carrier protein
MSRDEIRAKIRDILAEILEDDALVLTDDTTAQDVPWWDSLNHLKLLVAIEGELDIKFAITELTAARNVGDLVSLVQVKL